MDRTRKVVAVLLAVWGIFYVAHFLDYLGLFIAPGQNQAIFLGLIFSLTFLVYPAKKGGKAGRWYDWILVVLGIVPNAYIVIFYDLWQFHAGTACTTYEIVFFIFLIIALLEALRRILGIVLPIITLAFIVQPMISDHLPGILFGRGYSLPRITTQFFLPSDGIYAMPLNIAATIVLAFLFFGQMLVASGGGQTLMNLALAIAGRVRGGAAKSAIIASGMFGTLSGSPSSNVATTGTFTIPMMTGSGYKPEFAAGVEACASNGGQLLPPVMGVVAFIMAEMMGVPYVEVCYVAFIPAILYYTLIFLQVDFRAAKSGLRGLPASELPSFREVLKKGYIHVIPLLILIYFLFVLRYSPELSAFWAAISIIILNVFRRKERNILSKIIQGLEDTGKSVVIVGLSCAMAGLMMGSVSLSAIALSLSSDIVRVAGGNLFLLLILAGLASFIFGMGMTSIPCYIFVAIMVAPALERMGIPLISAHLFVFWLAMASFITPPVCIAAYVAAAISRSSPMAVGYWATRVGIGIFIVPFAFIYNPGMAANGGAFSIILGVFFGVSAVVPIAAGLEGYLFKTAGGWQRICFLVCGVLILVPLWQFRIAGFVLLAAALLWNVRGATPSYSETVA